MKLSLKKSIIFALTILTISTSTTFAAAGQGGNPPGHHQVVYEQGIAKSAATTNKTTMPMAGTAHKMGSGSSPDGIMHSPAITAEQKANLEAALANTIIPLNGTVAINIKASMAAITPEKLDATLNIQQDGVNSHFSVNFQGLEFANQYFLGDKNEYYFAEKNEQGQDQWYMINLEKLLTKYNKAKLEDFNNIKNMAKGYQLTAPLLAPSMAVKAVDKNIVEARVTPVGNTDKYLLTTKKFPVLSEKKIQMLLDKLAMAAHQQGKYATYQGVLTQPTVVEILTKERQLNLGVIVDKDTNTISHISLYLSPLARQLMQEVLDTTPNSKPATPAEKAKAAAALNTLKLNVDIDLSKIGETTVTVPKEIEQKALKDFAKFPKSLRDTIIASLKSNNKEILTLSPGKSQ